MAVSDIKTIYNHEQLTAKQMYIAECNYFFKETQKYFENIKEKCLDNFKRDLEHFKQSLASGREFIDIYKDRLKERKLSDLIIALYDSSPKMTHIALCSIFSPGKVVIYSNWVFLEGLDIMRMYLDLFGKINYVNYNGRLTQKEKDTNHIEFDRPENNRGEKTKVLLLGPAGTEGLTFTNIREIHIMESQWNESTIYQVKGRGIRFCKHKDLPIDERIVTVYRHMLTIPDSSEESIDQLIFEKAKKKQVTIDEFNNIMKRSAIDCNFHKENNMRYDFYKCSRVEDNIVDEFVIGPLYKKDFEKDLIYNSGREQKNVEITTNEVMIKTKDNKLKKVWLDLDTGRYYDYDTEDILGKIQKASDGNLIQDEDGNYLVEMNLLDYIIL